MAKVGRPSKYNPEYKDQLIAHMEKGFSYEAFAGRVRVCVDTLREWEGKHVEFSVAKKIGVALGRLFWERKGIEALDGRPFNATVWIFCMKNRFGWRDKQEIASTVTTQDGDSRILGLIQEQYKKIHDLT